MALDKRNTDRTNQGMENMGFDEKYYEPTTEIVEEDGFNLLRKISNRVAKKITVSGANTYVAIAPIGSSQASTVWQVKCINITGSDTVITWADGGNFSQVATDLTSLVYG